MRRAFSDILPGEVQRRKSKALWGFIKDRSVAYLAPLLLEDRADFRSAEYVNSTILREMLSNPQAPQYRRDELTSVLTLEVWLRTRQASSHSYVRESLLSSI